MTSAPKVLVVEDNPTEQRLLALLLNKFGFDAIIAQTGTAAIECMRERGSQLTMILMDWQMADMTGLECTGHLRDLMNERRFYIPIVAVTARAMLGDKQKCLNAGMDDYLSKPYTAVQLQEMVIHWSSARAEESLTG